MKVLFLLICIGSYYFTLAYPLPEKPSLYQPVFTYPPDFGKEYLESLANLAQVQQEKDSLRWQILWDWGYYTHSRNLNESLRIIQKGLLETQEAGDKRWEGRFQLIAGAILLRMDDTEQAELLLQAALKKIDPQDRWLAYTNLGYVYERRGDLSSAFEWAGKTLELGMRSNHRKAQAMAYSDLSYLLWKQGNYLEGLEFGLKSLHLFESWGIPDMDYDFTLYVVGNNLMALDRLDEAEKYFSESIAVGERFGFYNNLSDVYMSLASLYIRTDKLDQAENSAANALKYAGLLENSFMQMRSFLALGEVSFSKNEWQAAENYLLQSIAKAGTDLGDHFFSSQAYQRLSEVYEALGKNQQALAAFKMYHDLNQTIFNEKAEQKMAGLKSELALSQKNNTIKEQALILTKQEKQVTFWIVGTSLMLVFSLIMFRGYRVIRKKNKLLEDQNEEKTYLVRETHHRIKNNLQVVCSLLSLQSERIQDPDLQRIMLDSQNRVQSMGLVHQTLYQGKDLAYLEMKDYFTKLSRDIIHSFGVDGTAELHCDMEEMSLDIITAIPIGLIVNELITNSLKYAFPGKKQGNLTIHLEREGNELILDYLDDGIGFNEKETAFSLGFGGQLIQLLTSQLNGRMSKLPHEGTYFRFVFCPDAYQTALT